MEYERWRKTPPRRVARREPAETWVTRVRRKPSATRKASYEHLRAIERKVDFEQAIAEAKRNGPPPDVHPRVHQAVIEAMCSELVELEEFIADCRR